MSTITETKIENIKLENIFPSATNPRKSFDEKGLQELADSISEHGVLQPILVRYLADNLDKDGMCNYELVYGERRYRASKLAGMSTIKAEIRWMDDDEAFEVQIIENLERKDVHPLEEAEAFEKMINSGKYTITDIAAKMAKTESFVAQRLKLTDLIDEIKQDFINDYLGIGHAVLIARCDAIKQMDIYNDSKGWRDEEPSYGTIKELKETIVDDTILLDTAGFNLNDDSLGNCACAVCPNRSGANPVLFDDMQGDDRCFNSDCFKIKTTNFIEKEVAKIINDGTDIIFGAYGPPSEMVLNICKHYDIKVLREYNDFRMERTNEEQIQKNGFMVSGDKAGKYFDFFIYAHSENAPKLSSDKSEINLKSKEEVEANEELQKIQDRQKRALELDGEKVWEKIRATDKLEIKSKSNPLSQIELNALCFAMIDKLGYSGNSDVKKLVGDFDLEFTKSGEFTNEQLNQISRIFFAETLPTAFGSHDNVRSNHAYYKVIKEYYDGHVSDIELEQKLITDKRIEKANEKIEALKAKIEKLQPAADIPFEVEAEIEETDPAVENPNLFEKVSKKYALNNSYFKNKHSKAPANPLEIMQYFKQYGDLPFDLDIEKNPNWLYDTYIEYQKRNNVYHSQFFTPPATAQRIAELADEFFDEVSNDPYVLDACCGFGMLTKEIKKKGFIVSGFDFSKEMMQLYIEHTSSGGLQRNYEEESTGHTYKFVISNPPYEVPKLTKFLQILHSDILEDDGTAILLIPKGFINKEKPKALVEILSKYDVIHQEDMTEDFARTNIKAEIVVLRKA